MKLQSLAQQAQRYPALVCHNVFHLIDQDFLLEASRLTRKKSAPGVDQVTATQYAEHLDDNLRDLHERLRDHRYVAPPVERVWIEKDDGKKRPIGKPCFEEKIVQRAVVMIREAIFAPDFHACSHGFRKGHSPHQALHERREQCRTLPINWRVDADVSGFFDNLDWSHLREFLQQRVSDGGILRLIGKWLHAGVLEAGALMHPDKGTPQGGVRTLPTKWQICW
jgi:RNA-directed DNA polymerase